MPSTPRDVGRHARAGAGPAAEPHPCRRPLIIELFGPAAAGKSTLARALVSALEAYDVPARLESSARPAERMASKGGGHPAPAWPMAAPLDRAGKLFGALRLSLRGSEEDPVTERLLALAPPERWTRSVRLRRYLDGLARSWAKAKAGRGVIVYDQAYLSVLCSVELQLDPRDRQGLSRALAIVPQPDLPVHLDAPRDVRRARLRARIAGQGRIERLFEYDEEASLGQAAVASAINAMLAERGRPALHLRCLGQADTPRAVDAIVGALAAMARATVQ